MPLSVCWHPSISNLIANSPCNRRQFQCVPSKKHSRTHLFDLFHVDGVPRILSHSRRLLEPSALGRKLRLHVALHHHSPPLDDLDYLGSLSNHRHNCKHKEGSLSARQLVHKDLLSILSVRFALSSPRVFLMLHLKRPASSGPGSWRSN